MAEVLERAASRRLANFRPPTRLSLAVFDAKVQALRLRRSLRDLGRAPPLLRKAADVSAFPVVVAQSTAPLWSDPRASEAAMQVGKVHNLRRAAAMLDGLMLPKGTVFSFWRHVGKATRRRGFVAGRMLREGCVMPAVGGGLCQLSNALYGVALDAGCRIVERHAHSRVVPGSLSTVDRDATVAWNYVDLRFEAPADLLLQVRLGASALTVTLRAAGPLSHTNSGAPAQASQPRAAADDCGDCDQTDCFLHEKPGANLVGGNAAFVVDEAWPEFADHLRQRRGAQDLLLAPSLRRWDHADFSHKGEALVAATARSLAWRLTPPQGAARRAADARATAAIARALGRRLPPDVLEVTVAQSLLPYLWRDGVLGGRTFQVLMTRLPIGVLQARLDAVASAHPDRPTLADFRAEPGLAEAEAEALAAAAAIVTPHAEIAELFGDRVVRVGWRRPAAPASAPRRGDTFAFPGPTVARKGAFELRQAALALGVPVRPLGSELEGSGFWAGVRLDPAGAGASWLDGVRAVVHPALVEGAPRRLLAALAAGVPVIATPECGLDPQPGLTLVPAGDADALAAAMRAALL